MAKKKNVVINPTPTDTRAKFGFLAYDDMLSRIAEGALDQYDIVFSKDTKQTLPAIILAAVVNVVSNFVLVRYIGLWGVVVTSVLTYLVLLIYRVYDMRRYFKLQLYAHSIIPILLLILGAIMYYLTSNTICDAVFVFVVLLLTVYFMPSEIKSMILSKIKKT